MNNTVIFSYDSSAEEDGFSRHLPKNHRLFYYDETDSTNRRAAEAIRSGKAVEGDVFIARRQSAGRGTKGRSFFCEDGLYMSVILPKDIKLQLFTAFVSVCVVHAIGKTCGAECQIKWVNDIILAGKKLGGILCEALYIDGVDKPPFVIAGIGINTGTRRFPEELESIAASLSLSGYTVDNAVLAAEIVRQLDSRMTDSQILSEYKALSSVLGKEVSLTLPGGDKKEGIALDIGEDGSLIVLRDGKKDTVLCADVFPI